MTLDENGFNFIQSFEGCKLAAYRDIVGVWTIGVGHTGPDVYEGQIISRYEAEELLRGDVGLVEQTLNGLIPPDCTQNQFNALCSFGFNLGRGALATLLGHGWDQVPTQLYWKAPDGSEHGWIHAGGRVVPGLVTRRKAESALFLKDAPSAQAV